ncbi:hypothetical protein LCGC14_1368060 [marine sediment metagenome]|uniref:Uncharacterized protein n=1 Tax=marine sediment metagenome TaxID=412755 RepID=A0A0F9K653_9ZZZZ
MNILTRPYRDIGTHFGIEASGVSQENRKANNCLSYREMEKLLPVWRVAITQLRAIETSDPDGSPMPPNYGDEFTEIDYAPIPKRDLPFGVPEWFGDDAWGRSANPSHRNCVRRSRPDDGHTLCWIAPKR